MSYSNTERRDATEVDAAIQAMLGGELARAELTLQHVVSNAPDRYVYQYEDANGVLNIKFWDQDEFIHYATWQRQQARDRSVNWQGSAYPRAFYYLGFMRVKMGRFQ